MDKELEKMVYERIQDDIKEFANSLSLEEKKYLAQIPPNIFAKIYQAGAKATIKMAGLLNATAQKEG